MTHSETALWKKCSICKKEIPCAAKYYLCSVSTCKHPRKGYRFCSVACWDGHLGYANHRESWAEEAVAPSAQAYARDLDGKTSSIPAHKYLESQTPANPLPAERIPTRTIIGSAPQTTAPTRAASSIKTDTLVVVSKIKQLIKDQSDFNTSQCCIDALTNKVVGECLKGIAKAESAGRKTVMGRDID